MTYIRYASACAERAFGATSVALGSSLGASGVMGAARPARRPLGAEADERSWLAPEQQDFLDVLASRRREMAAIVPGAARASARVATAPLAAVWHNSSMHERQSIKQLQRMAPSVPIEGVLLDKHGPSAIEATVPRAALASLQPYRKPAR